MSGHTKKGPTKRGKTTGTVGFMVLDSSPGTKYRVSRRDAKQVISLLEKLGDKAEAEETVPLSEAFADLINEYGEAGAALRGARARAGLTQSQLSDETGIAQANISSMENGSRPIGKDVAKRLAKVLNVDYRVFL